jgi:IS605 OrfB family transposase
MVVKTHTSPHSALFSTRVLRLRIKDRHDAYLNTLSREVNFVWNFCNEHSMKVLQRERRFCSAYDLHPYLKGAANEGLSLHSQTLQAIAEEYVTRRRQFKKTKLRWRVSTGPRRSLGWIPFKASAIRYRNGQVFLGKQALGLWDSYGLANYELGPGNISQDARGRWYLNVTVMVKKAPVDLSSDVKACALGIDLGLNSLMADSNGNFVEAQRFYRGLEKKLAVAQRAHRKARVRALHAKIVNRRKDALHKLSTAQVHAHRAIFVGDVNAQALTQTRMAKSVLDAGWSAYRTMLKYKCNDAGVWFKEVVESYSTQECSCCAARTGPKGLQELHVRTWVCSACGAAYDRDTNAARVIKARGLVWLEQEFATAGEARADETAVNKDSGAIGSMAAPGMRRPVVGIPVL